MPALEAEGISLHYEVFGDPQRPPVMLLSGLGGTGGSWEIQIDRFARDHFVVLADHRGTGKTSRATDGYTIAQHAADMAALLRHLDLGPTHLVGSSTGGAIAQAMALDHAPLVRSLTMTSSFARADRYLTREFALRRKLVAEADRQTVYDCYALFLFSPGYAARAPERVEAWIDRAAAAPAEREIALKRIDMILAHDVHGRLGSIRQPVLVICGDQDFCTPPHLSREIANAIPGAEFILLHDGGHLIHDELPDAYFAAVRGFIARH
jgi:aminoacrylate hydrolase